MSPKRIVTGVLMAFVALSVVHLIVKETRPPELVAETQLSNDAVASANTSTNTPQRNTNCTPPKPEASSEWTHKETAYEQRNKEHQASGNGKLYIASA